MLRIRSAVRSSAGKNVSSASSDSVISTGVPKIIVVEIKLSTSIQAIATGAFAELQYIGLRKSGSALAA